MSDPSPDILTAVVLDAAEVRVDGHAILGPADLRILAGERWVLLGPNGSGKTTLLSLAGARRQPSRGRVTVLGERLGRTDVRRLRTRIGHVSHAVADRIRPALRVLDVVLTGKSSVLETWWQDLTDADRVAARRRCVRSVARTSPIGRSGRARSESGSAS